MTPALVAPPLSVSVPLALRTVAPWRMSTRRVELRAPAAYSKVDPAAKMELPLPTMSPPVQLDPVPVKVTAPEPPKLPEDSCRRVIEVGALAVKLPPPMTRSPASADAVCPEAPPFSVRAPPLRLRVLPAVVVSDAMLCVPPVSCTLTPFSRSMNTRSVVPGSRSVVQFAASVHNSVPAPPSQQTPPQIAPA